MEQPTTNNDIYEHVRQTGQQTSEKMKTRYDRKMNNKGFDEGSLVWLHNPVRSKGKSPKLQAKWDGPYRIVTRINDMSLLFVATLFLVSVTAKPQVLVDTYGYYAAPAYVASYSTPLAYTYPYAYAYSYPLVYY
ncbi:unnamed protein product [Parnassius mnemosyne]|uniref:Uncharacterized protein n=1 Tax=Parnassius mnemosyne TaxID=213953 RepID=A0AAV1M099_9NEOP